MALRDLVAALVALLCIGLGLFLMERPRAGLEIAPITVGQTPGTVMSVPGTQAPVVILAHGFAGSRQLMQPLQMTLARAGYITVSFDFTGHGRNPVPIRGDLRGSDGAVRVLQDEMRRVTETALALPGADGRVAYIGHSMGAIVALRQGQADPQVGPIVAISPVREVIGPETPETLLVINGGFEWRLRAEAERMMARLGAAEGETVGIPGEGFARRAIAARGMDHLGVIYAPVSLRETVDWLNAAFDRRTENGLAAIGWAILLTLFGVILLARPLAKMMPRGRRKVPQVPTGAFWVLAIAPGLVTPLILWPVNTNLMPVLIADYLTLHLGLYGALVLLGLAVEGDAPRVRHWWTGLVMAGFGILVVGGVLDRYVVGFFPEVGRFPLMAIVLPGALLAMLADAALLQAGQAAIWRRWVARAAFLASLLLAVVLDMEQMIFLLFVLPVFGVFYLSVGFMGGWLGRQTGSAVAMGIAMGVILGWAIAVSFPLFIGTV